MKDLSMKAKVFIYVLITLCGICILYFVAGIIVSTPLEIDSGSIMLSQISSTFIVLSLTSVLSTNVGKIYWQDIKDVKLIKPFIHCFYALTTYLITSMAVSIMGYICNSNRLLLSAFMISVVVLVALTIKMLSVYFGRDAIKNDLRWEYFLLFNEFEFSYYAVEKNYKMMLEEYEKKNIPLSKKQLSVLKEKIANHEKSYSEMNAYHENKREESNNAYEKYTEYSEGIIENTLQALAENNRTVVKENVDLLILVGDNATLYRITDAIIQDDPVYAVEIMNLLKKRTSGPGKAIIRDYAMGLLHKIMNNNCSNLLLSKSISAVEADNDNAKKVLSYIEKNNELSENDLLTRYGDVPLISVYFPNSELLEAYYKHNYSLCNQIIEVMQDYYNHTRISFNNAVASPSGKSVELKYLDTEACRTIDKLIEMDNNDAFSESKKRLLEEMKTITINI